MSSYSFPGLAQPTLPQALKPLGCTYSTARVWNSSLRASVRVTQAGPRGPSWPRSPLLGCFHQGLGTRGGDSASSRFGLEKGQGLAGSEDVHRKLKNTN